MRIFAGTWFIDRFRANPIMFLRVVRATVSKGVKHEYVRVVEAYRETARPGIARSSISAARICWRRISTSASSTVCCTAKRSRRSRPAQGRRCGRGVGLGADAGGAPMWRELGLEETLDQLCGPIPSRHAAERSGSGAGRQSADLAGQ